MPLTSREAKRKAVHIAVGGFALLLRWMTWPEAAAMALGAFLFNWQVLPRVGGRGLWREGEHGRGYPAGILLYPLAVLALVLAFRHDLWMAAAVWGVLAWGDGMASLAGQGLGGPRLPWNPGKTWAGFLAFLLFGGAAAAALAVWTLRLPASTLAEPRVIAASLAVALVCAVVESLPLGLDDNVTVPLAGGLAVAALTQVRHAPLALGVDVGARVLAALALNAVIAALAWRARALDRAGAASTVVIGTAVATSLGLEALAVMATFFVAGTLATRLGFARKAQRGIAQEQGGARGWRSAWANGAVPAALAVLAALAPVETRDLWALAYAASVATAAADTCSSEVGKAYGRRTVRITTLEPVAPGAEGGVSLEGTLGGLAGAALVALAGVATGLHGGAAAVIVAAAGLLGSLAESVIGALAPRRAWAGDHVLNGLNTAIGAAIGAAMGLAAR